MSTENVYKTLNSSKTVLIILSLYYVMLCIIRSTYFTESKVSKAVRVSKVFESEMKVRCGYSITYLNLLGSWYMLLKYHLRENLNVLQNMLKRSNGIVSKSHRTLHTSVLRFAEYSISRTFMFTANYCRCKNRDTLFIWELLLKRL